MIGKSLWCAVLSARCTFMFAIPTLRYALLFDKNAIYWHNTCSVQAARNMIAKQTAWLLQFRKQERLIRTSRLDAENKSKNHSQFRSEISCEVLEMLLTKQTLVTSYNRPETTAQNRLHRGQNRKFRFMKALSLSNFIQSILAMH